MDDYEFRPGKWRRLSSSRLFSIEPKDPSHNFNFLGLPLEIKLDIIWCYLSVGDILSMSLVCKDFKIFIDQYFLRGEFMLPTQRCLTNSLVDFIEKRYVLSLKVDFDQRDFLNESNRNRSVEMVKLEHLNLTKMKNISLIHRNAGAEGLRHDFSSDCSHYRAFMSICPWFGKISDCIFKSSKYIQTVDFTLFKNESSLRAMKILSSNAQCLKEVTLRSPTEYLHHRNNDNAMGGGNETCSLSKLIGSLLKKTAITNLTLVNFLDNPSIWSTRRYFLQVTSETLKHLNLRSSTWDPESETGAMKIRCPSLESMSILSTSSPKTCLFHTGSEINGLIVHLCSWCRKLKWFNDFRILKNAWIHYLDYDEADVTNHRYYLCSEECGLHGHPIWP